MKTFKKLLYYFRLLLFLISLILMFLTIKNYIRIGLWGYLFFTIEFIYIIAILITLLSKQNIYKTDLIFNIMHIGTYTYQIILSTKMFSFKVSSIVKESFTFYRNNYIILIILLTMLIFYSLVLRSEFNKKSYK